MAGVLQGRGEAGSPAQTLPPVAGAWAAGGAARQLPLATHERRGGSPVTCLVAFTPRPGQGGPGLQEGQRLQGRVCLRSVGDPGGRPLARTVISTPFPFSMESRVPLKCSVFGGRWQSEPRFRPPPWAPQPILGASLAPGSPAPRSPSNPAPSPPGPWLPSSPAPRPLAPRLPSGLAVRPAGLRQGAWPAGPRAQLCSAWGARAHEAPRCLRSDLIERVPVPSGRHRPHLRPPSSQRLSSLSLRPNHLLTHGSLGPIPGSGVHALRVPLAADGPWRDLGGRHVSGHLSLLPAPRRPPRLPCTGPRGSITGVHPGARPHGPSVASSGSWENPKPFPPPTPPTPPCCGLAASQTLQTQPCLGAFAHPSRARPQTPLPPVATWPPLLRPFRSPGGRVLTARTSVSSARVVICLRPASRLLRRPRERLRVSSGNTPGFEGSWPHPGCGPNSERQGESSGLSQRNGSWRGHKRSPVGPPTIFL